MAGVTGGRWLDMFKPYLFSIVYWKIVGVVVSLPLPKFLFFFFFFVL